MTSPKDITEKVELGKVWGICTKYENLCKVWEICKYFNAIVLFKG